MPKFKTLGMGTIDHLTAADRRLLKEIQPVIVGGQGSTWKDQGSPTKGKSKDHIFKDNFYTHKS